ncbi:hypothetical protein PybrP1_000687 [[Pythium] brassicae (nom. inval.)]|nr:hypothetical protein PybrP1_000687 [[Pythium] brassicae (nom. inval.)]
MAKKPQAAKKKGNAKGKKPSAGGGGKAKKPNAKTAKKLSQTIAAQQQRKPQSHHPPPKSQQNAKPSHASAKGPAGKLSQMQEAMRKRLDGGKFRMLNEQLYTTTGDSAFSTFQSDPELFDVYHQGFREMADKWPVNPLDTFISYVKSRPKAVVADFGCGDARLAESVPNTVHSFDLVSRKPSVTACNIADVPLPDRSVDIAVFCLALMGTSVREFLLEAHRVLRPGGVLQVAEVKSRFESEALGGVQGFVDRVHTLGFDLKTKEDELNKMFALFEFVKSPSRQPQPGGAIELKACEYKRR